MINAVSNYEKAKLSMANVFLQYDQDAMIAKISGKSSTSCGQKYSELYAL